VFYYVVAGSDWEISVVVMTDSTRTALICSLLDARTIVVSVSERKERLATTYDGWLPVYPVSKIHSICNVLSVSYWGW
jgi:hypothetical protein